MKSIFEVCHWLNNKIGPVMMDFTGIEDKKKSIEKKKNILITRQTALIKEKCNSYTEIWINVVKVVKGIEFSMEKNKNLIDYILKYSIQNQKFQVISDVFNDEKALKAIQNYLNYWDTLAIELHNCQDVPDTAFDKRIEPVGVFKNNGISFSQWLDILAKMIDKIQMEDSKQMKQIKPDDKYCHEWQKLKKQDKQKELIESQINWFLNSIKQILTKNNAYEK